MYHMIEFNIGFTADLEISPKQPLERLRVLRGTRASVCLRPYVVASTPWPVEVADLHFEDGSVTRQVPYEHFHFVE